MFCTQCGHENVGDSRFCTECGAPLGDEVFPEMPVAVPSAPVVEFVPNDMAAVPVYPAETQERSKKPVVVAVVAVAVVLVAALAAIGVIVFSGNQDKPSAAPSSTSAVGSESVESESSELGSSESDSGDMPLPVRGNVNDYSWDELAEIAWRIADAEDDAQAMEIAREYNLCNSDGELDGTQKKEVTLSDGRTVSAQIIGFRHDTSQDGDKTGISFLFDECVDMRCMNVDGSSDGGWGGSDLRAWLNGDFLGMLPSNLQKLIVCTKKSSNTVGVTPYYDGVVGETADRLWLPSAKELCGKVKWATGKKAQAGANDILNEEGKAYELYQDVGVRDDGGNAILKRSYAGSETAWWLRSVRSSEPDCFYYVDEEGKPHNYDGQAGVNLGVAPGFCI